MCIRDRSGSIEEFERLPLLVSLVMGVGLGSVIAGFVSGKRIELGLVPIGVAGMVFFLIALAFTPASFLTGSVGWGLVVACVLLAGLGVSAGFFDVPLNAYLQHKSPVEQRGRILSATNFLVFAGVAALSIAFGGLRMATHETQTSGLAVSSSDSETVPEYSAKVDAAVASFKSNWKADDGKPLSRIQNGNPFSVEDRDAHVSANYELIYADASKRIANDETVTDDDYKPLFDATGPDSRRDLKSVIRRASKLPLLSSRQIFFLMGLMTLPVFLFAAMHLARDAMRLLWVFMFRCLYRVKIVGMENLPHGKPAVLVANHSSWIDGPLVLTFIPQPFRVIAWAGNFGGTIMRKWAEFCRIILITGGPKSIRNAFQASRDALDDNEMLGLFPEGGISPNCQIRTLKPGLMKILQDREVPIIPVYLDQLWGSIFSYSEGKAIWKLPRSIRRPVCITIGKPVEPQPTTMFPIRQSMQKLSSQAVSNHVGPFRSPAAVFVKAAKRQKFKFKVGDTLKQQATGGMTLARALILRRLLRRLALADGEQNVGVLIPPTVGGAIVNLALALDKRVAINLNYSLSNDLMNHCIREAGIKHILTTKKVMEKFADFDLDAELIYLDDFKEQVKPMDKAAGMFGAYAMPCSLLCRMLGLNSIKPDDLMTIVFTSGSTGVPKGVMLSHQNVLFDVVGFEKAARFVTGDVIVGILPFFHSFGYTITLWAPMMTNISGAYHVNPLEAKQVGKLVEKFKGTILMTTPTFLRSYMRRCTTEQFATLNTVVTGAERLPPEIADQYEEKFGVRPVQGYGITELSPAVCANIPGARRQPAKFQVESKEGSVGRPISNVTAIVRDLDTDEDLGPDQEGMLWISGPTVMLGYLNKKEATDEVIVDGWFKTGDMARIDEDGFITITGRLSRFSKIGGEMVPHLAVEEVLSKFLDQTPDDDSDDILHVAVTSVPDDKKGERLVVLYTVDHKTPDEMRDVLSGEGLPNIFIPSAANFHRVDKLPILGTGKLDLRGIKDMANELYQ